MIETQTSTAVLTWWVSLGMIGIIGIILWSVAAFHVHRRRSVVDQALFQAQRMQLALAGIYAFGCAFRGLLPRADVQRICLYDSWISNVFVGRSVATVAELCFAIQWAIALRAIATHYGSKNIMSVANILVPMIVVAEICSWFAVITTNYLGNVIEQSLWTLSVTLLTISLASISLRYVGRLRPLLLTWIVGGFVFVSFMSTVDVPMYFHRWLESESMGRQYLSFAEGLTDLKTRWIVTYSWAEWKQEMAWMTLYFSLGVWASISLVFAPWLCHRTGYAREELVYVSR